MELKPKEILESFYRKTLDKLSAIENLISIIENSDNLTTRKESLEILKIISSKNVRVFKFLENLLISDKFEDVRSIAADILKENFKIKALEPMEWALKHEESPNSLIIIFNSLIEIISILLLEEEPFSKALLYDKVKKIDHKDFKISFEEICTEKSIETINKNELADILINYYTLILLEKSYWRLKFKIENCRVIELDFIFKGLTSLPFAIKYLTSLRVLVFRYNQILSIPEWISNLISLESLNLNVNCINKIPESMGSLKSLKELLLWKNELKELPDSLEYLDSLEILNLRLNQIERIPENIGNLKLLKELNLHDNMLAKLPESIGSLKSLEKLNLSWNELIEIPPSISELSSLKILDLGRNELGLIPDSIGSLKSLENLNLSENRLLNIPATIGNLISLRILNLSRNELSSLPESIENLIFLEELYLTDNRFNNIYPEAIEKLKARGIKIFF